MAQGSRMSKNIIYKKMGRPDLAMHPIKNMMMKKTMKKAVKKTVKKATKKR